MTTAQVVDTSVTVNNNSPIQDYVHPDDHTQTTYEMTAGFKPFTENERIKKVNFDLPFAHSTISLNNCQTPLINWLLFQGHASSWSLAVAAKKDVWADELL